MAGSRRADRTPSTTGRPTGIALRRDTSRYSVLRCLKGRVFTGYDTGHDSANGAKVAVINRTMAKRFWREDSPVGVQITVGDRMHPEWVESRTIVGVVADVRDTGLDRDPEAIGLYGLIAYSVEQRTQEIGIRMALGAQYGMRLALPGVAIGVEAALALGRLMNGFLYGVQSWDPEALASVAVLLMAVALTAAYIPARRAVRVDPMEALRCG
jgi:hypothetical protein